MHLWTEVGRSVPALIPHVDVGSRTPGGPQEVIALDVVGADVRNGVEVVIVQMPPAVEANEAWFVALTRSAGGLRVLTYERAADGDAVLAELRPDGRSNFGFHPDTSLVGFTNALSQVLGVPLQGLAVPTTNPMDAVRASGGGPGGAMPRPPEKKGILVPLLLALLFFGPGLITFSFALRESSSFSGDWVVISLSLLVAGGLCVAWMLTRLMGKAGLAVGAVLVSAGFSGAFVMLGKEIDARDTYRKNYDALMKTKSFCDDRGDADDRAKPYDADGGPHATLVFAKLEGDYGSFSQSYAPDFKDWEPEPHSIRQAALIACLRRIDTHLETCRYDMGASLERMSSELEIRLFSIESGEEIFQTKLAGKPPRQCANVEKFYGTSRQSRVKGELPPMSEVKKVLEPYVEP